MKICAVIPAFNESRTVGGLSKQLLSYVDEVIVVDDGSTDDTGINARDGGATVVRHLQNRGKGAALQTGFNHAMKAGYDAVITIDADGQHDYREIPLFINEVERTESDIILGTRMGSVKRMPFIRLLTNIVTSFIVSILSRQKITDSQTGFRLIKRKVLEKVRLATTNYETESEILIEAGRKGFRISEIPIRTIYGRQMSKINAFIDTLRFIRLVLRTGLGIKN